MIEPTLILAFLSGVLTVATPCIIPILPPMLAGSIGHRLRPLFIVLGSSVTFTLMGGLFSLIGIASGVSGETLRFLFIAAIIAFGAVMVDDEINEVYVRYSSKLTNRLYHALHRRGNISVDEHPLLSAFILGMALGIVWIPCVGPILGSVLAYATMQGNLAGGSLLLLAYAVGLGIPMLAIAYGGKYTSEKIEWTKRNSYLIKRIAGWVLILTGVAMIFGIDKFLQQSLLPYFPELETRLLL
ncbi:MAG: cytochrome c biogenesis CcdA family protein [Candidatus Hydrothermarchaeales archaeon]